MIPEVSIVIPVYNEEKRIPKTIGKIFEYLGRFPLSTEVVFVNDGSHDNTEVILREYRKRYDFRIVSYAPNRGKGYAVRQGMKAAYGRWIVFFDIDLATPLEELKHLIPFIENGASPIIVGNRIMHGSSIKKGESFLRVVLGKGFSFLSRLFVWEITDFTCGFKCFRRDAAERIFSAARIDRWAFDTEIM